MVWNKKTQAAMEFLMTYGWALLLVVIVISGLAYFGLLNPDRFLPDNVNLGPGLSVTAAVIDEAFINIYVNNGMDKVLDNFQINATECSDSGILSSPKQLVPGKTTRVTIPCNGQTINKKFDTNLKINYTTTTKGHTLSHAKKGEFRMTATEGCRMEGILGGWMFDDDYDDCSGNGHDGSAYDDATTLNSALVLDGSGDYVLIDHNGDIDHNSGSVSVSVWVNIEENTGYWQEIVTNSHSGSSTRQWAIAISSGMQATWWVTTDRWQRLLTSTVLNTNQWYHLVLTHNTDKDTVKLYIDSVLDKEITHSNELVRSPVHLLFGKRYGGEYVNGSIDEVMVFDRTLTEDEVLSLYQAGR